MDTNGIAETVDASVPDMLDHFFRAYDTVLMKKEIFQKRTFLSGQRKGYLFMLSVLAKSIREYKKPSLLAPLLVSGEVVMECIIPFVTANLVNQIKAGCSIGVICSTARCWW